MTDLIRIVLADDQALVRRGLSLLIGAQADMEVVAEAENGNDALVACQEHAPDVALLDIRMPDMDGLEVARRLVRDQPAGRVVMLTTFDLDGYLYEGLKIGVSGFFLKDDPPEQLISGIRAIVSGASLFSPSLTRKVVETYVRSPAPGSEPLQLAELTAREREILTLLARGMTNAEIAEHLIIGEATVKTHVSGVLTKLDIRDRAQAVVVAYESGLVRAGERDN